jgi:hypothetical protein
MNNPTGDTPWEEEPGAETVRHVDGDMVSFLYLEDFPLLSVAWV